MFVKEKLSCDACATLKNKNISLNENVLTLSKIVDKFTNGKKNFETMFGKQKGMFDKGCIG